MTQSYVDQYNALVKSLFNIRQRYPRGSTQEDAILDKMENIWYLMPDEDHDLLHSTLDYSKSNNSSLTITGDKPND
jgi:hypothetical protein